MIPLSAAAHVTIARALLEYRASRAKAAAHWESCRCDPHAPEVAASFRIELASADATLREFQAVAPLGLSDFLQQQIALHRPITAIPSITHQETP